MQKIRKIQRSRQTTEATYSRRRGNGLRKNRKRRRENTQKSTFCRSIAAKAGCPARERKRRRKNKEKNICR